MHFYTDDSFRCKILDKHLQQLAPKHLECKFAKINAEKCPFLTERLRIKVIPTMAVIKDGKLYIQAGGGVVADSIPRLEWKETHNKARAMFRAAAMVLAGGEED